jgi:hypothetical protein
MKVVQPVFSQRTGWVVGVIDDHRARPMDQDEVNALCDTYEKLLTLAGAVSAHFAETDTPLGIRARTLLREAGRS